MQPYEILEHTADAKFRAYGKTKEEAFANAIQGMTAIVTSPRAIEQKKEFPISVQSNDLKSLLFDMLDATLFLMDTEHFIPAQAENLEIKESEKGLELNATLKGDDIHKHGGNLKAVTYSEMLCEEKDGVWVLQVVIDI